MVKVYVGFSQWGRIKILVRFYSYQRPCGGDCFTSCMKKRLKARGDFSNHIEVKNEKWKARTTVDFFTVVRFPEQIFPYYLFSSLSSCIILSQEEKVNKKSFMEPIPLPPALPFSKLLNGKWLESALSHEIL